MENWLGMPVQVLYTTPRTKQQRILHHRNNYIDSTLTASATKEEKRSQIPEILQQVVEQPIQKMKREVREYTQKENHTTSFFTGNNKVGTDSVSPSIHGFSGYDL